MWMAKLLREKENVLPAWNNKYRFENATTLWGDALFLQLLPKSNVCFV